MCFTEGEVYKHFDIRESYTVQRIRSISHLDFGLTLDQACAVLLRVAFICMIVVMKTSVRLRHIGPDHNG
jgi:hypothetical protein